MDLRSKLARLKPLAPAPPSTPSKLEDLRARLGELIDRSRQKHQHLKETRAAEIEQRLREAPLPFDEVDGLHVRRVQHPVSHRVGRISIRTALDADGHALSLLALDASLSTLDPRGALYLDTESTGLAGGTGTVPFLVGVAWFEGDAMVVEQYLLRRLGEETPILMRVAELLAKASMIVSFNGKAFDLPLIRTRFVMNRLPLPKEPPHLDLVHLARRVHRTARGRGGAGDPRSGPTIERADEADEVRRATSCKLVALERQILGFGRVDDVPSAEVPARYSHFLRTGDADAIRAVCDHNLWDVVSMAALVGVYAEAIRTLDVGDTPELGGRDMVGIARTLARAGDIARARRAADVAVTAAVDDVDLDRLARHTRGGIAKGARDTHTALLDFERLSSTHDDPLARLELAKLYEHRLRDPARALEAARAGTTELPVDAERRNARLERKAARARESKPRRK